MIKINKDLSNIPTSLKPATDDFFLPPVLPHQTAITTHGRRLELISARSYINKDIYNGRYKTRDIKTALNVIYNGKCAFCERKVEQSHVEHYRPKDTYYWLAYSWDNLLFACATCNQFKGTNFDVNGTRVRFKNIPSNIRNINSLSTRYDLREAPKMINPEITNPLGQISFTMNGAIDSTNVNFKYTIDKCQISRTYLRDDRKRILDILTRDLISVLAELDEEVQKIKVSSILEKFIRDASDETEQFLAFRKYAISNNWLKDILVSLN